MDERAMPKPNCTGQDELDLGVIDFGRLGRREVQGCFDGGSMTSDAGVMLLSATDRKIGLTAGAARCIADPRNPLLIKHAVRDMLRQRVYGLALGWEDLKDHKALRLDVAMQTAVARTMVGLPFTDEGSRDRTFRPTLRCSRCATAGFAHLRSRLSSNVRRHVVMTVSVDTSREHENEQA